MSFLVPRLQSKGHPRMNFLDPINNNVILQYVEDRQIDQRDSGILTVTREAGQRQPTSTVLQVPDEIQDDRGNYRPSKFKVGDKVIFNYSATKVAELDGTRYLIVEYKDVFAVVRP